MRLEPPIAHRVVRIANICTQPWSNRSVLNNISNTTEEVDFVWKTDADSGSRGRQQNGQSESPIIEDERLLDHHIEEMLGAFRDAAGTREAGPPAVEQRPD
jgi:hypothetical protein